MKKAFHRRGDLILQEKPFACVLQPQYRQQRCDRCFKQGKVLKCSNCLYVRYCNRSCQTEAWPDHKDECAKLKALPAGLVVPAAALMMARIIRRLQKGGDFQKGYYTQRYYRRFHDLMPHEENIRKDTKRIEHFESLSVVLLRLLDEPAIPAGGELLRIYGKMCINSFNIVDNETITIGTAMYLGASILDHSCRPNAVATFVGETLQVRLLEDYAGSEVDFGKIFISYIDLLNPADVRRGELADRYYFGCECERCRDEAERKLMNAAACPSGDCEEPLDLDDGKLLACPACRTEIKHSHREQFQEIGNFTKEQLAKMKDVAYLDVCQLCLKKQKGILHHFNVYYLKTLDHAFECAIDMEKWTEAIGYGLRLVDGFRKYHGPFHPLFGLLLLKVGKMQLYLCQFAEAMKSLHAAEKIVRVTHGEQHDLYRQQLVPLLCDAAREFELAEEARKGSGSGVEIREVMQ
uniref:MYND-type domain-containing protein n=1 Tax=Anopheles atroparvus TaxID=41427 RepID=A0AAG5DLL3_ANOAO